MNINQIAFSAIRFASNFSHKQVPQHQRRLNPQFEGDTVHFGKNDESDDQIAEALNKASDVIAGGKAVRKAQSTTPPIDTADINHVSPDDELAKALDSLSDVIG